jgi:N utilization substance protein B
VTAARPRADVPRPRSLSRAATVQALYQMDLAETDLNAVIAEFSLHRLHASANTTDSGEPRDTDPGETLEGADIQFFADLVRGVVRRQRDIDQLVDQHLADGWRLVRIDSTLRAILRSAAFELLERTDVPGKVVITEYINIAHAFFEGEEPRVVNGVLDRIARRLRAKEFPGLPTSRVANGLPGGDGGKSVSSEPSPRAVATTEVGSMGPDVPVSDLTVPGVTVPGDDKSA